MRKTTLTIFGFLAINLTIGGRAFGAPVTIKGGAVAPSPDVLGTGLCMASAVSIQPAQDFSQSQAAFNTSLNNFMEVHKADRVESVLVTIFDLSNNNVGSTSHGDFIDAMVGCSPGGCNFAYNDAVTSFGSRLRGYLNVTESLANKPIHFGLYLDDAASITIFDNNQMPHNVITRATQLGFPTWRSTNTVTFEEAGLYPIEILYANIAEHAALEASYLVSTGTFTDFELPSSSPDSLNLKDAGFTLLEPSVFHQTVTGGQSFPDPTACAQCDRQYAEQAGTNGCPPGMYCNSAALCSPCATALFCGPTCSPCGGSEPFCESVNGAFACVQCKIDTDCSAGELCQENKCVPDGLIPPGAGGGGGAGGDATSGAGGDGGQDGGASGGCSCRASGGSGSGGLAALLAGALVAVLRRRRAGDRVSS